MCAEPGPASEPGAARQPAEARGEGIPPTPVLRLSPCERRLWLRLKTMLGFRPGSTVDLLLLQRSCQESQKSQDADARASEEAQAKLI